MNVERRLERLEAVTRDRALAEVIENFQSHSDEEIAVLFADPYNPPAWAEWEHQEALLEAAGARNEERMEAVVKALNNALEGREENIRRHMKEGGYTWAT